MSAGESAEKSAPPVVASAVVVEQDEDLGEISVVPGRFCKIIVTYPIAIMLLTGSLSIVLSALAFTAGATELGGSFTDTSDPIVRRLYGFLAADRLYDEQSGQDSYGLRRLSGQRRRLSGQDSRRRLQEPSDFYRQRNNDWSLTMILYSKKKKAVSNDGVKTMRKAIKKITNAPKFRKYCHSTDGGVTCEAAESLDRAFLWDEVITPSNCTTCVADVDRPSSIPECDDEASTAPGRPRVNLNGIAARESLRALCESTTPTKTAKRGYTYVVNPLQVNGSIECMDPVAKIRQQAVGGSWNCISNRAKFLRAEIPFGYPIGRDALNYNEDRDEDDLDDYTHATIVPLLFELKEEIEKSGKYEFVFDGSPNVIQYYLNQDLMFLILAMGLVFFVLATQINGFIACCGMFEILVSFPVGLFVWSVVLRQEWITYLMYNGAFIILGIGADDIFVLMDAWGQSRLHPDPRVRGDLLLRFTWAYNRAASAMLATSITTFAAFASCASSRIWDIQCFGVVAAVMVAWDYFMVITWLPAAIIVRERYFPASCKQPWPRPARCKAKPRPEVVAKSVIVDGQRREKVDYSQSNRATERFFAVRFASFILARKAVILAVFGLLFVGSIAEWVLVLRADTESTKFFAETHPFERFVTWESEQFLSDRADEKTPNLLVFGIEPKNPWKETSESHPACVEAEADCSGKAKYSGLDFAKHQVALREACVAYGTALKTKGQMAQYEEPDGYCFIDRFARWANDTYGFPYSEDDPVEFARALVEWRDDFTPPYSFGYLNGFNEDLGEKTGFTIKKGIVQSGWVSF